MVTKRRLRFFRARRRESMDDKRSTHPRYKVGAEEVGLVESPRDRVARVQETREGVRPERAILDPSFLSTATG